MSSLLPFSPFPASPPTLSSFSKPCTLSSIPHANSAFDDLNGDVVDMLCELIDSAALDNAHDKPGPAPADLPPPLEPLHGGKLDEIQKISDARIKKYQEPATGLRKTLNSVARFPLEHISHAKLKEVLIDCGADNIDAVHWGSAVDAMLSAVPNQLLKLPIRYLMPVLETQVPRAGVLPANAFQQSEIEGLTKVLQQPVLGANRTAMRAVSKPFRNFGFFGKGVTPGADGASHAALIAQVHKALNDVRALIATRVTSALRGANEKPPNDETLEALRDQLVLQLQDEVKKNLDFLKVMAFEIGRAHV